MSKKFALIIGNGEYQDSNLARLVAPSADVNDLAELLRKPDIGGFDEVTTLINEFATTVRRSIARFFAHKKADDLLLLYFSGHGVLDDRGELFLAVRDTERDLVRGTALPAAFITREMDGSGSQRQVLILDCCHSGAFARGTKGVAGASVGTASAFEGTGYGRAVLTATDATQYAWEGDQVIGQADRSVFTHYLVEGLRTGAADTDGDGRITLDEWYDYVYAQVVSQTPKQTPGKWSYKQQGEIVIASNPRPVVKPVELPAELKETIEDSRAYVREGAVRELDRLLHDSRPGLVLAAYDALKRLSDDDSRRVAAAAAQVLEAYEVQLNEVKRQPAAQPEQLGAQVRGQPQTFISPVTVPEGHIQAEPVRQIEVEHHEQDGSHPARTLLLTTVVLGAGWAIAGYTVVFIILWFAGKTITWPLAYISAIVAGIGGLVTGLRLGPHSSFSVVKQASILALGWGIGWGIGSVFSLSVEWAISGMIVGALTGNIRLTLGFFSLQFLRTHGASLCKVGRVVVVLMLLLGFFGPWAQISSCGFSPPDHTVPASTAPDYNTYTGVFLIALFPLMALYLLPPVLVFLILTILRLGPKTWQEWRLFPRLERVFAIVSLVSIGFVSFLLSFYFHARILWGLLVELAGVVTGLLILFAESMTLLTTETNARLWRYVLVFFALLGLIGLLVLVLLRFQ